jgi:hypothetical protein
MNEVAEGNLTQPNKKMKKEKTKMKIPKNKTKIYATTFVLVLTISAILVALPTIHAQVLDYYGSHIYVTVSPRIIGVGQMTNVVVWTADMPPDLGEQEGLVPSPTGRASWYDITVTVTRPNNTTQTLELPYTDSIGAAWVAYTPTEVGTYYFQANFPGTWRNGTIIAPWQPPAEVNRYYEPAVSDTVELIVQEEPIQAWQETPLSNDYWTRPISCLNREWYQVTGNWLRGAADQWPLGGAGGTTLKFSYGPGPETAHVLWTKPLWEGGIMDSRTGVTGYATFHYQGLAFSPIILNGKLYYAAQYTAHGRSGWYCVDLYTGETLWYSNDTMPSMGQIYNYESPNQHGGFPYVWRTSGVTLPDGYTTAQGLATWEMLDGHTGNPVTIIANVSAPRGSTAVYGKDGSIVYYQLATTAGVQYLLVWNSSAIPSLLQGATGTNAWQWRPAQQAVHDGNQAWSLNVTISPAIGQTTILAVREGEYILGGSVGSNDESGVTQGVMWKLSLERGQEGVLMWNRTFTPPFKDKQENVQLSQLAPEDGMFFFSCAETLTRWGYSLDTMEMVWESEPEEPLHFYSMKWPTMGPSQVVYQGKLISCGYGGVLTAYNATTGDIVWKYEATTEGFESPYGGNYPIGIGAIADGKLYIGTGEHSPTQPLYRGRVLQCINASDGELLWNFPVYGAFMAGGNSGTDFAIADGILLALNGYDNQIYAFGRGPSATTVSIQNDVITHGNSVMIKGTVTDQSSSGRRNTNGLLDFTLKGTPAISDEDMSAWMEYMFMQQPKPKDAKGVEVLIETLDPNGNYYELGRTTSDTNGAFGCVVDPPVPGKYQIIATFEGSESYGSSTASTYLWVEEAPSAAQALEPEAPAKEPTAPEEPAEEPVVPEEPTEPEPTEPKEPEPTEPEPTEPEPAEPTEAPLFSTTDLAIIAAVAVAVVIGVAAYWQLRKRK